MTDSNMTRDMQDSADGDGHYYVTRDMQDSADGDGHYYVTRDMQDSADGDGHYYAIYTKYLLSYRTKN